MKYLKKLIHVQKNNSDIVDSIWSKHYNNLTLIEKQKLHDFLLIKQEGCCAICGTREIDLNQRLAVDHNHTTSQTRGLLCHKCNMFIGLANDNVWILRSAIEYLTKINEYPA